MRIPTSVEEAKRMIEELQNQNKLPDLAEEQIDANEAEIGRIKEQWQLA